MPVKFFSPEYAREFQEKLNSSEAYQKAGLGWRWTVGLISEAAPESNFPEASGLSLDLYDGVARSVEVSLEKAKACDFVITGAYSQWKKVMRKELDPTRGMLTGKLKVKGDLPTLIRYTRAANAMVDCSTQIDTVFPDES